MAVVIYRSGDSHHVNGVSCELKRVEASSLDGYLDDGWVMSLAEIGSKGVVEANKPEAKKDIAKPGFWARLFGLGNGND